MKEKKLRKNIKKRLANGVLHIVLILLVLPFSLTLMFSDPMVQTLSARLLTMMASKRIGHIINIESIQINVFTGIVLEDVYVDDHKGNLILGLKKLEAKPLFGDWRLLQLDFLSIHLDSASFAYGRYKDDVDFAFIKLLRQFSSKDKTSSGGFEKPTFKLHARNLVMKNSSFHFFDENASYDNGVGMNYADILVDSIQLKGKDFIVYGDSISCHVLALVAREQSGIVIDSAALKYGLSKKRMSFREARIQTNKSSLDLDFEMYTHSYETYGEFIDSVVMWGQLKPTTLNLYEVGYFSDIMFQMPDIVGVTGSMLGTVEDFVCQDARVHYGSNTRFFGNVHFVGLPDVDHTLIEADIKELSTTACDLKEFRLPIEEQTLDITEQFDCDELIQLHGSFNGYLDQFSTSLEAEYMEGNLLASIDYALDTDTTSIQGHLAADSLALGALIGMENLMGRISFTADLDARKIDGKPYEFNTQGYTSSLQFNEYTYNRIGFDASMKADELKAKLRIGDRNLMLNAETIFDFGDKPGVKVEADLIRAHMDEINLWPLDDLGLKGKIKLDFNGFDLNTMTGQLLVDTALLSFGEQTYPLNRLALHKSNVVGSGHVIDLIWDYGKVHMDGHYQLLDLPDQVINLLNSYYQVEQLDGALDSVNNKNLNVLVDLDDVSIIRNHIVPSLDLGSEAHMEANFNFSDRKVKLDFDAEEMNYMGVRFQDNHLTLKSRTNGLKLNYTAQEVIIKDSTEDNKTVFGLDDMKLSMGANDDLLDYKLSWDNEQSQFMNRGDLRGSLQNMGYATVAHISRSDIWVNDTLWTIDAANRIVLDSNGIVFHDVAVHGGISRFMVKGTFPEKDNDSLRVEFDAWNLSNFDLLTQTLNFDLDGIIDGDCDFSILSGNLAVVSDITINDFYFNEEYLGTARLFNTWDNVQNSVFVKSQIVREGAAGIGEVFVVDGYYYPFRKTNNIDLDISFNRFKLRALEPFLDDYVSQIEGKASGDMTLSGSLAEPVLSGSLEMNRTSLLINYLNTKYSFSNTISFEPNSVNFDQLILYDTIGNQARINGQLKHQHFSNPIFDAEIVTDRFLFFNTTRRMNELYYGTAIMSGNIQLKGSPEDIKLSLDANTGTGTDVSLPLEYSVEISDQDYIVFVKSKADSLEELESRKAEALQAKASSSYEVDVNMGITPDAKVTIYLPSDMGSIETEGLGDLSMQANSSGDMSLVGDYNVEKGSFHFTIGNLVSKRFELVRGGRISWTGDPYEANVNMKGLYRVKANLNSLGIVIDDSSSIKNRVNVECYVILSNQLLDPDISFEIKIPELDPDLKRAVFAELDTTNPAMMNQQMISLLVLGSFSYSNASNLTLSSSYYTVLSNQLSGMLSQISDAFDIGVNYKPGDEISQEEFEVALSTQLFDDRLTIDGNFGVTYDRSGQNASNIVGDVDIGYKLTKNGRWVLKAFNHSNTNSWYNYANYDKVAPYTQGIGIAFRKEFNKFAELFQRSRPRKPKNKEENQTNENL